MKLNFFVFNFIPVIKIIFLPIICYKKQTLRIKYRRHVACKLFLLLLTIKRIILKIPRMNLYGQIFAKIFMQNNYLSLSYIYILLSCNLSRNLFFLQNYSNIFFFFNVTIQIKYECLFIIYPSTILKISRQRYSFKKKIKKKKKYILYAIMIPS